MCIFYLIHSYFRRYTSNIMNQNYMTSQIQLWIKQFLSCDTTLPVDKRTCRFNQFTFASENLVKKYKTRDYYLEIQYHIH